MKQWLTFCSLLLLLALGIVGGCRENFDYTPTTGTLSFSRDTVFLDTVFTNIGSSTYSLKVFNTSDNDILIPEIRLRNGQDTQYRLNVDGLAGNEFQEIALRGKDSLFIFIETTFDISTVGANEFLYTDAILFGAGGAYQNVELVTLVKDATFLFPRTTSDGTKETLLLGLDDMGNEIRIEGFVLEEDELLFTNEKPYVVYGYAAVTEGQTLQMEPGTRVHFHKDSGILVGTGGSLQLLGSLSTDPEVLENEIIFEGDRLEPQFSDVPGQWGTIWLTPGSTNNRIEYTTIKNASVGLLVEGMAPLDSRTLEIANSQIHNSSSVNLWARNAFIEGENCVFGSAGTYALYCNLGGNYRFTHSTIANYWTNSFRNTPALFIDDHNNGTDTDFVSNPLVNATFANCIIDGNRDLELLFSNQGSGAFSYEFRNCAIKFNDRTNAFAGDPLYDFENLVRYPSTEINLRTSFTDPSALNFQLEEDSEVVDFGDSAIATQVPLDLLGISRVETPDLGAFERQIQ